MHHNDYLTSALPRIMSFARLAGPLWGFERTLPECRDQVVDHGASVARVARGEHGGGCVGVDNRAPALDLLNSSQRVSRPGSARLGPQKGGLPIHCGSSYHRFKAIDARLRGSRLPLTAPSNML